mgnify:CR=1 FL=1
MMMTTFRHVRAGPELGGPFFLARERVVGPSNFHSELANCFQAATDVMRAVKEATEGMLSLHRNDVRSAYPYFGKPMIARTRAYSSDEDTLGSARKRNEGVRERRRGEGR